jgi:hypothetical protein
VPDNDNEGLTGTEAEEAASALIFALGDGGDGRLNRLGRREGRASPTTTIVFSVGRVSTTLHFSSGPRTTKYSLAARAGIAAPATTPIAITYFNMIHLLGLQDG